ncbi:MAG: anion transporter [Candidatus Hydrothermarchaeaceae archaeon]
MLKVLAIFALTYILISGQRLPKISIDRPTGSMIGAVLIVLTGVLTFEQAIEGIDFNTITLLLGMMILVTYLAIAGFLDFISIRILQIAKNPFQLLVLVAFSSGILSALFVNDTIVLIYTPILIRTIILARLKPMPYLIVLATASNIGSAATIVGNPQNMLIGMESKIPFLDFALHMLPIAFFGLIIDIAVVALIYRREIFNNGFTATLPQPSVDEPLLRKTVLVVGLVLFGFLSDIIPIPLVAISGATILLLLGSKLQAKVLHRVDWPLLFFFCNLFVVMHGVEKSGLADAMFRQFSPLFQLTGYGFILGLGLFSVIGSNLVSNVPFVMMMLPFASKIGHDSIFWYTLAMSSTFAGNFTIIGSVANMIVVESSRRAGIEISFFEFFKVGATVTLLTVLMGSAILSLH